MEGDAPKCVSSVPFIIGESYAESVVKCSRTMWTCLCCGVPFTFPDANTVGGADGDLRSAEEFSRMTELVHKHAMDRDLHVMQWSAVEGSVLDETLLRRTTGHLLVSDRTSDAHNFYTSYVLLLTEVYSHFGVSMGNNRCVKDVTASEPERHMVCLGCYLTSRVTVKEGDHKREKVPIPNGVCLSYLQKRDFEEMNKYILVCFTHIAHTVVRLMRAGTTGSREWRQRNMFNYHIGFVTYQMLGLAGKRPALPFHIWYMCVFSRYRRANGKLHERFQMGAEDEPEEGALYPCKGVMLAVQAYCQLCEEGLSTYFTKDVNKEVERREIEGDTWAVTRPVQGWPPYIVGKGTGMRTSFIIERMVFGMDGFFVHHSDLWEAIHGSFG